jgi:hypothetical protein
MVRIRNLLYMLIIFGMMMLIPAEVSYAKSVPEPILRIGSKGQLVREVQGILQRLNYLRQNPSGYYGRSTAEAVKSFQLEHAIQVDGITGPETMAAFRTVLNKDNGMAQLASRGRTGGIITLPWSIVNQLWKGGETAIIIDVATGRSFQARRLYGYYHADVEPLTRTDTESMLAAYGGQWSWERRAVLVCLRNLFIAASINGMPHGKKSIAGNGFPGQFCVHFLGSRVHQSGKVDLDHLAMIQQAATFDLNWMSLPNEQQRKSPMSPTGFHTLGPP